MKKEIEEKILEIIFSNLEKESELKNFTEIYNLTGGYAFKSQTYAPKGIFVLRVTNIEKNSNINLDDAKFYPKNKIDNKLKKYYLKEGDILVVMVGGSLGKVGYVKKEVLPALLNQNMWRIRPLKENEINSKFTFYLIKYLNNSKIKIRSSTHGHMSREMYKKIKIPLIKKETQEKIVHFLEDLKDNKLKNKIYFDEKIEKEILRLQKVGEKAFSVQENSQKDHELLKKLKQAILQEAVQGKLVPQNPNDEPASELLKKIKKEKEKLIKEGKIKKQKPLPPIEEDEIPYKLPKGWVWCRLGEVCRLLTQGPNPKYDGVEEEKFRVLKTKDFYDDKIYYERTDKISKDIFNKFNRFKLLTGDLIFGLVGVGSTGKCNIFLEQENKEFIFTRATGLIRLINNKLVLPKYAKLVLNSPFGKEIGNSFIDGSTGQIVIKTSQLKIFSFPLPPLSEQKRIVAKVDELMKYCDLLEEKIKQNKEYSEKLMGAVLKESFER